MSTKLHDDAICIRQWDWSETSQTVSLFTKSHGVVRALAKGAKRPKAPYSGGIELLTRGEAGFILKPGSDLALLTSWDLRQTFPAIRRSLAAHNAALYMADLVQHFVRDHDPHALLFESLHRGLAGLESPDSLGPALLRFQWSTLVEVGYQPTLDSDSPASPTPRTRIHLFDPAHGGLIPGPHLPRGHPAIPGPDPGSRAWRVRGETIDLLRELASSGTPSLTASPEAVRRASRLLAAYLRHLLGAEPPTQRWVFGPNLPK